MGDPLTLLGLAMVGWVFAVTGGSFIGSAPNGGPMVFAGMLVSAIGGTLIAAAIINALVQP